MLKHGYTETGFPDLWSLRGYWGACCKQQDSDGDGISDAAEEYYEEHPEEFEELQDYLEAGGGNPYPDDAIGDNRGGGGDSDPNTNEYGISHDDWDELSQNQQRDIAHEHGDAWHGQPAPAQDHDDGGSSQSASTETSPSPTMPGFETEAEREDWLADQRQKQWDEQERERKQNVEKGRKDWGEHVREREERLREEGRAADADRLRDEREAQREQWDQDYDTSQGAGDQARRDYIDRPSIDRDTRIQQYQDADANPERRKMREALANIYPQSSAAVIEQQLWHDWAWEDAPPPPSAGRISAATGPNAVPLFSESLDPMVKLGWETGAEYLERVEAVQAMRDQLSQDRALRETRGEQQFPGESDAAFRDRRVAMRQGPSEAPQSALGYALEQLNAQGLGPAEYAAALERLSRNPWFHGIAYEQERDWLAGKADFYRTVGQAIAIGQTGMGEDLDAAIDILNQLSAQPAMTTGQRDYLGRVIDAHERAGETVTAASESAIEAWEGRVLGNINAFGDPDAKARARAVLDDKALTGEERWDALAKIEAQAIAGTAHHANLGAWEDRVLGNINAFGDPETKARARAVLDDGTLTGEERRDALARIEAQAFAATAHHANLGAWEGRVLGNINTFGSPEAKARAQAVLDDGNLTGEERRDALTKIQVQAWEYIKKHNEEVAAENLALAIEHGYVREGPDRTPMTPEGYLRQLQVETYRAATRNEAGTLEDQAVIASANLDFTEAGSLEDQDRTAAYNRYFADLTGELPTGNPNVDMPLMASAMTRNETGTLEDQESIAAYNEWFRDFTDGQLPTGIGYRDAEGGLPEEQGAISDAVLAEQQALHDAALALFSRFGGDDIAVGESQRANARYRLFGQYDGSDDTLAAADSAQALWEAGLRAPGNEAASQTLLADLAGSHRDLNELTPGELDKATRIASGEFLPALHVDEIALDPMGPFDRESFEQALLQSRHDPDLNRQVWDYARGYGLHSLALPESEMNARRLRLLAVMAYGAPIPGLGLGRAASWVGRPVARAAGPVISTVARPVLRFLRPGVSQAVPVVTSVADDAVPALARNVNEFTRLLDTGKARQAGRYMLKNAAFKDWALAGGLAPADIQRAGLGRFLQETAALPPNILQRALGNRAFNVAAQAGRSALVSSGIGAGISTGIAVAPSGGEDWGVINRDEIKGILDSGWQSGAGGVTGNLVLQRANVVRRAAGKSALGKMGQYKLAAVEGAGTDTALSLVPGFQDPTFGRINRNEQLGIGLSTVAAPAFDAARGIAGLARRPRSLFPSAVSATGLRGGTQKFHYSQVAAGDDVELREVGSLADDGLTPISTLQPEASIRREIERRLSVHPQRIRPGDESGLDYDKILSQGLDPVSGLRLKEDVLDALARGETDIRGVTPSGIPYRFTPPAAYRTGVFAPGAAAHLSPDASFAIRTRGDAPGSTFTTRSTNPSTVEEVLYLQPGAMAPRYFEGSASGNTGADAARESLRETAAGFAGLPNFARRAIGLPPVHPAALVLTPEEVKLLTARNVVEDGPDELPSKSFPGASDTKGRDPLPVEVFGSKGAEAEVVIPPARDLAKRRIALHILGGGAVAVHPDLPDPGFRDIWGTNVVALSDQLPFGTRVGLRLDRSPEQLGKAREFFEDGGVRRNRDNTGRFEVDAVVGGVRYRIRTDDDPAVLLGKVRSGSGGDVTNVIIRDTETGSVRQGTAPDAAEVVVGRTRSPRDSRGPLRTWQEPEVDPRSIRTQADVVRATAARAGRADAGRVDTGRADAGRVDAARADAGRVDAARVDAGRVDAARADAGRVDAARADAGRVDAARADAGRVDTARADAGRVDTARADAGRVDTARADAGRVDTARADAGRVDTARADAGRVDAARADAGRVDAARADAGRVDTARTTDAGRVDTARTTDAGRVNAARTARADAGRVDTPRARVQGATAKRHIPPRKRGEEPQEGPKKPRLPIRFPKTVRFQTVEEVEVDLETGDTTRTPVGNRPTESLRVVERGESPHTDQHYAGRITDVLTDEKGHPYIAQKAEYQGQRPRRLLPKPSELGQGKIKRLLDELKAQGRDREAPPPRSRGRRSGTGGGRVSPAPGPGPAVRRGRRGMTTLERTRLKNFAPR